MNNLDTVIILPPAGVYTKKIQESIRRLGFKVYPSIKGRKNVFFRCLRVLSGKYNIKCLLSLLYGEWKNEDLDKINSILIFHDKYSYRVYDFLLNDLKFKGRIYLYYLDPISTAASFDYAKKDNRQTEQLKIYSFEKKDCEKYGFHYNTLFFFKEDANFEGKTEEFWYDVFFIGADKNRVKDILEIKDVLEQKELRVKIHISKSTNKNDMLYGKSIGFKYKPVMQYEELLKNTKHTKAVLDIVPCNQEAVTLRVYEGLFLKRKVITNNINVKQYPFYCKDNIFIYGEDNIDNICDFLEKPFNNDYSKYMEELDFEKWIGRFI